MTNSTMIEHEHVCAFGHIYIMMHVKDMPCMPLDCENPPDVCPEHSNKTMSKEAEEG